MPHTALQVSTSCQFKGTERPAEEPQLVGTSLAAPAVNFLPGKAQAPAKAVRNTGLQVSSQEDQSKNSSPVALKDFSDATKGRSASTPAPGLRLAGAVQKGEP